MSRIPVFGIRRYEAIATDPTFENSVVPSFVGAFAELRKATISFVTTTYLRTYLFIYLLPYLPTPHPSIYLSVSSSVYPSGSH